jgi:hypothetical protein
MGRRKQGVIQMIQSAEILKELNKIFKIEKLGIKVTNIRVDNIDQIILMGYELK